MGSLEPGEAGASSKSPDGPERCGARRVIAEVYVANGAPARSPARGLEEWERRWKAFRSRMWTDPRSGKAGER
jgi:hypothetical protein